MSLTFTKLKMFRKQSGMTQEALAEKLGVSRQAVAKWEKGESMPDLPSCIRLADLFGTTVDMLVREMNEQHSSDGKHIFGLSRMNEKGQITLPKECRALFGLSPGDGILVLGDEEKGGIALIKVGELPASEEQQEERG